MSLAGESSGVGLLFESGHFDTLSVHLGVGVLRGVGRFVDVVVVTVTLLAAQLAVRVFVVHGDDKVLIRAGVDDCQLQEENIKFSSFFTSTLP